VPRSVLRLAPVEEVMLDDLHLDLLRPPSRSGRPYVALNFVLTADGRASFRGRAEIGTRTDRELMFHLRSLADAVLIGAGTLRVDPFAPVVRDERALARRADAGKPAQPLAVVVSGTCVLPLENRYFAIANPRLVATSARAGDAAVGAVARREVEVLRLGADAVDLTGLLGLLAGRGVRFLLCEGGPRLAGQLLALGLVDEAFLTHATLVTAEPGARRLFEVDGPLGAAVRLERVSLHESADGERYERSRLRYGV
jgi:riboflavin biosynthesis pyrimidine reductase